ncbi:MAG: hypothetical protein HYZ25_19190 [Chloroflexi bacterium]|nr:hypothetical protein [Chloroflexota bacterium]
MPRPGEFAEVFNVQPVHYFDVPTVENLAQWRAEVLASFIDKFPGDYSRKELSAKQGTCIVTNRNQTKRAGVFTEANEERRPIYSAAEIPAKIHGFIESCKGNKLPADAACFDKAAADGLPVHLVIYKKSTYWRNTEPTRKPTGTTEEPKPIQATVIEPARPEPVNEERKPARNKSGRKPATQLEADIIEALESESDSVALARKIVNMVQAGSRSRDKNQLNHLDYFSPEVAEIVEKIEGKLGIELPNNDDALEVYKWLAEQNPTKLDKFLAWAMDGERAPYVSKYRNSPGLLRKEFEVMEKNRQKELGRAALLVTIDCREEA